MANENIVSTIAGTVTHQKSAGNLKPMASNGALIANAKRGALIDLSNTQASRVNGPSIKDGKDAAFKAPPQRGGGVAKPLSGTQAPKPPVETRASAVVRTLGTNKTIIYQDDEPNQLKTRMLPQEPITSEDDTKAIYEDAVEELLADATVYQSVEPVNARTCAPVIGEPVAKYPASNIYVDDAEENYSDCYSELDEESFEDEREWSKAEAARYLDYSTYTNTGRIYGMVGTPIVLDRHFQELAAARALIEATESLEEIEEEYGDIGMVREYSEEIFEYMIELEKTLKPDPHYMDRQTELRWSMRSVLVDWVVQVHARFHLYPETLHLTVNLIDRFLSRKIISLGKLQLVGATALLIACKYEEVNVPSVREIVYMVDEGYQAEEILKAEKYMSNLLDWQLGCPSPLNFLRRTSKADDYDEKIRTVAKYLIEVAMMDERFVASGSSLIAAGSHCLARHILRAGTWTPAHVHYSGYTYEQLVVFMANLQSCLWDPQKHHPAVYDKYKEARFEPSVTVEKSVKGFVIPPPIPLTR